MLLSVCLMILPDALDNFINLNEKLENIIYYVLYCLIGGICLFNPLFAYMLPIFAFNIRSSRNYIAGITCMMGFIYSVATISFQWYIPAFLIIMAVCIEELLIQNSIYHDKLIKTRDDSKEYELLLEEKNRTLMENQDANVLNATLSERNRIAREIHDNVGHMLTRSILQIGAIKAINKDPVMKEPLENLHSTLDTAMNNIRSSVHDLHDESINVESALKDVLSHAENYDTSADIDTCEELPRNYKYAFIAIAKEAVNNAIKHSDGNRIDLILRNHPGFYQLTIKDNGHSKGINYSSGIGMSNMEDRAKQIGGTLRINTNKGFSVIVTVMK